jgi:lysophospholipase L1-like esterase
MVRKLFVVLVALSASFAWGAGNDFHLKNGDRVVFYGDSITEQRMYTMIAETYAVTRYPKLDVTFVNTGWGGDTVNGGGGGPIDVRLDRDVTPYHPTVMTIMLGMNDGGYKAQTPENDEKYFTGYKHIIDKMKSTIPGIEITAIEPSPYDDVTVDPVFPLGAGGEYNQVLISYGKWIAKYASTADIGVADLNTGVVQTLIKAKSLNPQVAKDIIPGRVHPSFAGHLVMADLLLKAWGARPLVSAVTIDAAKPKLELKSSEHATVSDLFRDNGIAWTELDDALPLPFAQWQDMWGGGDAVGLVLASSDITATLNEEPLRVTGLKNGAYSVKIDGQSVGAFNNDELAKGINLALLKTPMTAQAMKVYELTTKREDVFHDRWRTIQVPLADYNLPQTQQVMDSMNALEKAITQQQHEAAQPKTHKFEIVPVSLWDKEAPATK